MFLVLGLFFFFFGIGALAGIVYSFFKWGIPLIALIIQTIGLMVSEFTKGWRTADPAKGEELGNRWAEKLGVRQTTPWRGLREEWRLGAAKGAERGDRWAVKLGVKKAPSPAKQAADGGQDT